LNVKRQKMKVRVKLSMEQAVVVRELVRRRRSRISEISGSQVAAWVSALLVVRAPPPPQEVSWYSFLSEA
jgi:hypothetical protein